MKRPFDSMEEMNEYLIDKHNSYVKPGDRVYHLGDFAWNNAESFLNRLKGNHYLIRGNHDYRNTKECGFIWVKDVEQLTIGNNTIWLSHFAHMVWPRSHYGSYHLYGHSHGMLDHKGKAIDVGVDHWEFAPANWDVIRHLLEGRPISNHHPIELAECLVRNLNK
jgi:calcineurin-like phosphoesterase family protein